MRAICYSMLSWGFKTRGREPSRFRSVLGSTAVLWGFGIDLLSSRACRFLCGGIVAAYVLFRPRVSPSADPRANRLIEFFNSLERKRKRALALRLLFDVCVRSLRRYRRFIERRGDGSFDLTAIALSIGGRCNLGCDFCIGRDFQSSRTAGIDDLAYIFSQLQRMDAGYVSIIGAGEPFLDERYGEELLACLKRFERIVFFVYTNGTTLSAELVERIRELDNIVLVVSVDGPERLHDARRGSGSFARVRESLRLLRERRVPFGFSTTVDAGNYREATSVAFIETMADAGALIGLYNQSCNALHPERGDFARDCAGRSDYLLRMEEAAAHSPIYIVDLLSFEERRYGCRARKGTSCFIDAVSGTVAPCLLLPFGADDGNIYDRRSDSRLEEILGGAFFEHFRREGGERRLCVRDMRGELERLSANPWIGARDRERVLRAMEVIV